MRCEDGRKAKHLLLALWQRAGAAHGASAGLGLFGAAGFGAGSSFRSVGMQFICKAASEVLGWLVNACRESLCRSNKHFGDCYLYCSHVGKNNYMLRNHVKLSSNLYKIKLKVTEWMLILAVLPLAVTLGLQPLTSFCVQ